MPLLAWFVAGYRPIIRQRLGSGGASVRRNCPYRCVDPAVGTFSPRDEPIVGQGPFVMNTSQEIRQAMADYMSGKMGRLS